MGREESREAVIMVGKGRIARRMRMMRRTRVRSKGWNQWIRLETRLTSRGQREQGRRVGDGRQVGD